MGEINIRAYQCERCSHRWVPRQQEKPRVCPRCKSPYWDLPRKNKNNSDEVVEEIIIVEDGGAHCEPESESCQTDGEVCLGDGACCNGDCRWLRCR